MRGSMVAKNRFFTVVLGIEATILGLVYVLSPHGVQAVTRLRQECAEMQQLTHRLKQEVVALDREIIQWETEPFYKEKVAREQLQMARRGDTVYFIVEK